MNSKICYTLIVALIVQFTIILVSAETKYEIVQFKNCLPTENVTYDCDINEIRVSPCPEAKREAPCKLKHKTNGSVSFDFTPKFAANELEARVYWVSNIDIRFEGMDSNACQYTTCPTVPDQKQTYTFGLPIHVIYPRGTYKVKWILGSGEYPERQCCFQIKIKIVK